MHKFSTDGSVANSERVSISYLQLSRCTGSSFLDKCASTSQRQ